MMILIWPILFIAGFSKQRITIVPFAVFLTLAIFFNVINNYVKVDAAASLGQDQSYRWHPVVFAIDVIVTMALYSATYIVGYGVGRWSRNRKRKGQS